MRRLQQRSLYVTSREIPIHFVLADMATREYDNFVCHDLADERIRKAVQERAPHLLVFAHCGVHLRMQAQKADGRVDFRDERSA